jgi:hypothetical protein
VVAQVGGEGRVAINEGDFFLGFVMGFLLAGVVGFLLQRIALTRRMKITDGRKQRIDAYTQYTPAEVVRRSSAGRIEVIVLFMALLAVLAGCFWVVSAMLSGQ